MLHKARKKYESEIERCILVVARRRDQAILALDQQKQQQGPPQCILGLCPRRTFLHDQFEGSD